MWLKLWKLGRWLLIAWVLLILGGALVATTQVESPITTGQERRVNTAPERVFNALRLDVKEPFRFPDCVSYTEDSASFVKRLERLPDSLFTFRSPIAKQLSNPIPKEVGRISFLWDVENGVDAQYTGILGFGWQQKQFCLSASVSPLQLLPVTKQWQKKFRSAFVFYVAPLCILCFSIFNFVILISTPYAGLRWLSGLAFAGSAGIVLFIGYWYFLASVGLQ
jgi:hypothetical protein